MLAWLLALWSFLLNLLGLGTNTTTTVQQQQNTTTTTTNTNTATAADSDDDDNDAQVRRTSRMQRNTVQPSRTTRPSFVQAIGENNSDNENANDDNDDDNIVDDDNGDDDPKIKLDRAGRIAAKKAQKKAYKQQKREYDEQMRADRERKEQDREKREAELEAKRFEEEQKRQQEANKIKEEEARKKQQEYDEWRHMFTVDESGEAAQTDLSQNSSLLQQFIDFVKESKVVVLEDLASHFQIRTEQVIERLQQLEEDGTITGLFDDRGKFIYLTEAELHSVAKFIEQRGRVAIRELVQESNKLIQLKSISASKNDDEKLLLLQQQ